MPFPDMDPDLKAALLALLSRKFIMSFTGVFLVYFLPVPPETKMAFITGIVGIYGTTNVVQKIGTGTPTLIVTEKSEVTPESTMTEKKTEKPVSEPPPNG